MHSSELSPNPPPPSLSLILLCDVLPLAAAGRGCARLLNRALGALCQPRMTMTPWRCCVLSHMSAWGTLPNRQMAAPIAVDLRDVAARGFLCLQLRHHLRPCPPRQQPKIRVGNADFSPDTHKWDIIVQSNWRGMKWSSVASAHAWS
jgi:hypothetical protein